MTTNVNDIIAAAIAAAQNNAAAAAAPANTNLPSVQTQNTAVSGHVAPRAPMQLEDAIAGMSVDGFIKLKHEGIFLRDDPTPFQELKVRIRGSEIAPHKAVRFGNPATYKKSYDGATEFRTGKSWAEVVAQCQSVDPRCTGDYDAFDLPFHLVNDVMSMITPGKVLAPAGTVVGYSTAITAGKDVKAFVKNVILHPSNGKDKLLEGVIKIKRMANDKGKWGILEFGDLSNWKAVDEMPPEAEIAA